MALTEIEYGSLASSEVINNNFQYLDNRISSLSETVISNSATVSSNIASVNSTIANLSSEMNSNMDELSNNVNEKVDSVFSTSGLYITTYKSGNSWYREYFSDSEKTQRVWLEQGGYISAGGIWGNTKITFLKPFKSANINFACAKRSIASGDKGSTNYSADAGCFTDVKTTGCTFSYTMGATDWRACGV